MKRFISLLICLSFALTACGVESGNQRPEEKKLVDSIKLLLTYMDHSHPNLINWNKSAVEAQLKKKLPTGYATDAGWTIKDRKSTRLNSSHVKRSRMPSSA